MSATLSIYTAGHGARTIDALLALLGAAKIGVLVDVRLRPVSRRYPHFSQRQLGEALDEHAIEYVFEGRALGGFREPGPNCRHSALASDAFRGYAEQMATPEFRAAADRVLARAAGARLAVLCAERFPVDCHRNLLADHFATRGAEVIHLIDPGQLYAHVVHPALRRDGEHLIYDAGRGRQLELGFS